MTKINLLIIGAGGQIGSYFMVKLYSDKVRLGALDLPQKDVVPVRDFLLGYWRLNRLCCGLSPNMHYIISQYPTLPKYLEGISQEHPAKSPPSNPAAFLALLQENLHKIKPLYI